MSYEMYLNNTAMTKELYQEPDTFSTVVHYLEPDELVSYQGSSGDFSIYLFYHSYYDSWEYGYSKESGIDPLKLRCHNSGQYIKPVIIKDEQGNEVETKTLYFVELNTNVPMYDGNKDYIDLLSPGDKLAIPYDDLFYMGQTERHWISFSYYEAGGAWFYAGETRFSPYAQATECDEPSNYTVDY